MSVEERKEQLAEGHPIHTYQQEAVLIKSLLEEFVTIVPSEAYQKFYNVFNHLAEVERRFERKENQLFPYLEKHGWDGPSKNMWTFHDMIREMFRTARKRIEAREFGEINQSVLEIKQNLTQLLYVEDEILFPNALSLLTDEEWIQMRKGEEEIGWMLKETPANYPAEPVYVHPSEDKVRRTDVVFNDNAAHYDEGFMTVEQVNLLFRTLPVDITYVDENDKVIFYNRGDERLFPRSPGVIGREVKYCHPPKSVDTVLQILEAFRNGSQNEASFWINYKGRTVLIRYFAVRDQEKNYRGVVEMSQDITDIKLIEGERRLLEWK
jgi:uncharacterized protein